MRLSPDAVSLAEKMLKEFSRKLSAVKLIPGAKGSFEITIGTDLVFSKLDLGRFPETKEVREMVKARA